MNSAVADFNDDGVDDIILTNHNEDGRGNAPDWPADQYAFFSTPGGTFEKRDLNFVTWGRNSFSGDFNNDGRLDFAVQGWTLQKDGSDTAVYFQNPNGTFTKKLSGESIGGNITVSGDFDGDGELEIASFGGYSHHLKGFQSSLWELNDDGSVGSVTNTVTHTDSEAVAGNFGGHKSWYGISVDDKGKKFLDNGLHFCDTGDVNGDGATDVVAIHYGQYFKVVNGHYKSVKPADTISIYSAADGHGLEQLDIKIKGWTPPDYLWNDIHLVDWNGDGHLDIFVPWEDSNKDGYTEAERVFLNDGTGNFTRLAQKFLPSGDNLNNVEYGDFTDANHDGIMDVIVRPRGFDGSWQAWDKYSESLYLGTRRIYDGTDHNPAVDGAAGFNESYYRSELRSHHLTIKGHMTALEHYLNIGRDKGLWGFAAGTHVYGYEGDDRITLRQGNETAEGLGGDDTLIGGLGADTLSGGKGTDIFRYLSAADSGISSETRDTISDFQHGTDQIDLRGIDAVVDTSHNDAFSFLHAKGAAFTSIAGQLRWYVGSAGALIVEGDVDGDSVADFQIEVHGTKILTAADFAL
jgi:hypothetical protein